ncbi:hypothetical protein J1N35_011304, partial [Gossypium stocksii]
MDQDDPRTYQKMITSPDPEKWFESIRFEMDSMSENQEWILVDPLRGVKPIGCKWVFKKKIDMDGNIQTYKGRFVAKGFRQVHGIDIKTTFLNKKPEEYVYMTQPEGFIDSKDAGKICKLQRSIYGLKQASQSWKLRFNDAIKEFGFIKNEDKPYVYKKIRGSTIILFV